MGKKFDFSIFLLIFIAAMPVAFTGYELAQLINAVQTLDAYKQAPICSDKPNCRKVLDVKVLKAQNIGPTFTFYSMSKRSYKRKTNEYQVVVSWDQNKTETLNFQPYRILDVNKFDTEAFFIPTLQINSFAETYLQVGDMIQIEMWNGKITIIFIHYFTQSPASITPHSNENPILIAPAAKTFSKIPLATTIYPPYAFDHTQTDFTGSIFILFIAEFVIFAAIRIFR